MLTGRCAAPAGPRGWQAAAVSGAQSWAVTVLGMAVVALGLRDVFHTLWHPGGRGGISRRLMAGI